MQPHIKRKRCYLFLPSFCQFKCLKAQLSEDGYFFFQIQYIFGKQTVLQHQFSTDTCSSHFSNLSSMNSKGRENFKYIKMFHQVLLTNDQLGLLSYGKRETAGMRKKWLLPVFCQDICYSV